MAADAAFAGGRRRMTGHVELRSLTGMRGIAAWAVVLYHIRGSIAGLSPAVEAILAKGYLAVDFFFLLSGFVIALSYRKTLLSGGMKAIPGFLTRRIARIWPLHLFMLGCALSLALLLAATGRHDPADYPFGELPLHVLLIQNWGLTTALAWNDPSWSISAELAAYLAFPFFAVVADWERMPSIVAAAVGLAALVLLHVAMTASGAATLGTDITRFGVLRCLCEFTAGAMLSVIWTRWRNLIALALPLGLTGLAALAAAATGSLPETLAVPFGLAGLLLALALASDVRGNPLSSGPIPYLGKISYATYLGHFLLFVVFKLVLVTSASAVPTPVIALYLITVFASSVILHHLIELPAQHVINNWWLRRTDGRGLRQPAPRTAREAP